MKSLAVRTQLIMKRIALKEQRRIVFLGIVVLLLEIVLLTTFFLTAHRTILNLIEKDFFSLIFKFEYDINKIFPQMAAIGSHLWTEIIDEVLGLSIVSAIVIFLLIKKSKIRSFPRRLKETRKYLK